MSRPQKQKTELDQAKANKTRRPQAEQMDLITEWQSTDAEVVQHALAHPARAQPAALMALQGTAGNQAVQRLVVQRQPEEEEEAPIQAMPAIQRQGAGDGFRLDDETAGRINRARGGGQPLDGNLQAQMGAHLGYDFSGVRVHTGQASDELNQQLSARAFTTGRDIFFRRGEYNPGSGSGRQLIAHELTHVVQQGTGRIPGGGGGTTVRPVGDAFEQEANVLARAVSTAGSIIRDSSTPFLGKAVKINGATQTQGYRSAGRKSVWNPPLQRSLWENTPAQFKTKNTTNDLGDSEYKVNTSGYMRYAPINLNRRPKQVYLRCSDRSVAYIRGKDEAINVLNMDQEGLRIETGNGSVTFQDKEVTVTGQIAPASGYHVFDAKVDNDGRANTIHVGHAIYQLNGETPNLDDPHLVTSVEWNDL